MTTERSSALEALEGFWKVIRQHAESDPKFAQDLLTELKIPVRFEIEPKSAPKLLDPIRIAGQGYDEFRRLFRPMSDADLRKVIVNFGIAPKESVPTKGPKGEELFELLWNGASTRRNQLGT